LQLCASIPQVQKQKKLKTEIDYVLIAGF